MKYLIATIFVLFGITFNAQAADCVDFAGKWRGECVGPTGEKTPSALDIEQKACTNLKVSTISTDFLRIGDGLTFSQKIDGLDNTTNFYTWWNKDNSIIEFFMHVEIKGNGKDPVYQDNILGGYKMENTKLITYSKGAFGEITCTHTK